MLKRQSKKASHIAASVFATANVTVRSVIADSQNNASVTSILTKVTTLRTIKAKFKKIRAQQELLQSRKVELGKKANELEKKAWELRDLELKKLFYEMVANNQLCTGCQHDNLYKWEKESNGYFYDREGCSKCHTKYVYFFYGKWLDWDDKDKFNDANKHIYEKYKLE